MGNDSIAAHADAPRRFAFANVVIDATAHCLTRDGREIPIEPKAFAVLLEFLAHPGELRSRDDLLDAVWGHTCVTPGTLNRIVAQLRKALGDDIDHPHCIQTVHGLGYRFIAALDQPPAAKAPTLRFAPPAHARLPQRAEPLIGRERDIAQLGQLLRENRLVTVAGAGGIGKTQLALEVARRAAVEFPDGAWLFDCSATNDAATLTRGLADLFDIRATAHADELLARLCELLQSRRTLLLFDNGERVAGPLGSVVETLLAACGELHVLVTSQHRLNSVGEALLWLPPLDVPAVGEWSSDEAVAQLAQVPAVALLLARSRAFASVFALTCANASAVAGICRQLDGLPLSLEIAAARLRLLSPEQLLARMDKHLLALAEANPRRPDRHQTLHALIAWSYSLLSEREQALLGALGVFAGPCTLGGANAVGAVFGLNDDEVLDVLGGLIDKSLLSVDVSTNPPSYRLLDSVRLFALQRLAESGDETRVRDAHLDHFVWFTECVDAEIQGEHQQWWADRVKREWANLHAAFDHALARPPLAERALALAGNLGWYFRMGTDYAEAARWLERALDQSASPTRHRAMALIALGIVLHHSSVRQRSSACLREGILQAGQLGDTRLVGVGQAMLAGERAMCGDFDDAEACVAASLALAQTLDDDWLCSVAMLSRGIALGIRGQHREAEACLGEAFALVPSPGSAVFQRAYTLINLALQRFYLGDVEGAARDWRHDLDLFIGIQHWRGAAGCVEGAAYVAGERGDAARAARFLAAAAKIRRLTNAPLFPHWEKAQRIAERKARDALGNGFDAAWHEGAAARFERIVDEARASLEAAAPAYPRSGASKPSGS